MFKYNVRWSFDELPNNARIMYWNFLNDPVNKPSKIFPVILSLIKDQNNKNQIEAQEEALKQNLNGNEKDKFIKEYIKKQNAENNWLPEELK